MLLQEMLNFIINSQVKCYQFYSKKLMKPLDILKIKQIVKNMELLSTIKEFMDKN